MKVGRDFYNYSLMLISFGSFDAFLKSFNGRIVRASDNSRHPGEYYDLGGMAANEDIRIGDGFDLIEYWLEEERQRKAQHEPRNRL